MVNIYAMPGIPSIVSPRRANMLELLEEVMSEAGYPISKLKVRLRKRENVDNRAVAMWIMNKIIDMSLCKTGAYYIQHHATAIHAINNIENIINLYYERNVITDQLDIWQNILRKYIIKCSKYNYLVSLSDRDKAVIKRINSK